MQREIQNTSADQSVAWIIAQMLGVKNLSSTCNQRVTEVSYDVLCSFWITEEM